MRALLPLLLAVACVAPPPAPAPPRAMEETEACSAEYTAARRCLVRIEARRMAAAAGLATRPSEDTLLIRGAEGDTLRLVNGGWETVYRYDRYLPEIGFHLVEVRLGERDTWLLVDARTTRQTRIIGVPVVSPRRTRFAASSVDLLSGREANGVQVWRLGEGGPRLEWAMDGGGEWGASGVTWTAEDAFTFTRYDRPAAPGAAVTQRPMRATLSAEGVNLRPGEPLAKQMKRGNLGFSERDP